MKSQWFMCIEYQSNASWIQKLVEFDNWLQKGTEEHEQLVYCAPMRSKIEAQTAKKRNLKINSMVSESNFNSNNDRTWNDSKCATGASNHRFRKCDNIQVIKMDDRSECCQRKKVLLSCWWPFSKNSPPQKKNLRRSWLWEKTLSKLLFFKNKSLSLKSPTKTEVFNLISNAESVRRVMKLERVRIFGEEGQFEGTLALCDTGSTQTWVGEDLLEKIDLHGDSVCFNVDGVLFTQFTPSEFLIPKLCQLIVCETKSSYSIQSQENLEIGISV